MLNVVKKRIEEVARRNAKVRHKVTFGKISRAEYKGQDRSQDILLDGEVVGDLTYEYFDFLENYALREIVADVLGDVLSVTVRKNNGTPIMTLAAARSHLRKEILGLAAKMSPDELQRHYR